MLLVHSLINRIQAECKNLSLNEETIIISLTSYDKPQKL